jgi:hypothetical protein
VLDTKGMNRCDVGLAHALSGLSREDLELYAFGLAILFAQLGNELGTSVAPIDCLCPPHLVRDVERVSMDVRMVAFSKAMEIPE